jgi:hypothetical protein
MRRSMIGVVAAAVMLTACGTSTSRTTSAPTTSTHPRQHRPGNPFAAAPAAAVQSDQALFAVLHGLPTLVTDASAGGTGGGKKARLLGLSTDATQFALIAGDGPFTLEILDQRGHVLSTMPEREEYVSASHTLDGWLIIDGSGAVSLLSPPSSPRPIGMIPTSPKCHSFQPLVVRAHAVIAFAQSEYGNESCQGQLTHRNDIYELDTSGQVHLLADLGDTAPDGGDGGAQPLVLGDGHTILAQTEVGTTQPCGGATAAMLEADVDSGKTMVLSLPKAPSGQGYDLGSYWATTNGFTVTLAAVPRPLSTKSCQVGTSDLRQFSYANGSWSQGISVDHLTIAGPDGWSIQASGPFLANTTNVFPSARSTVSIVGPLGDRKTLPRDTYGTDSDPSESYSGTRWAPST